MTKLCDVDSDLSGADETKFKEKNKKFWKLKDAYYRVDYQVKVLIGAADLRFELCKSTCFKRRPVPQSDQ